MTDETAGEIARTDDGRHIIVNGRRWRATDPRIPEKLRQELVNELMAARRLVRSDPATARPRVQDAKVALGERGKPWWEDADDNDLRPRIESAIRSLLRHRDGKTICPSDVARVVGGDSWRSRMDVVRAVAGELAHAGTVTVTQRGEAVDVATVRGPIRIRFAPEPDTDDAT